MDSEPEDTEREIDGLRRRVEELEGELARLRDENRTEREHTRLRHQDHALGLIAEAEAAHAKNVVLTKRLKRIQERVDTLKAQQGEQRGVRAELDQVYASRSWRLGRALTRPGRVRRP